MILICDKSIGPWSRRRRSPTGWKRRHPITPACAESGAIQSKSTSPVAILRGVAQGVTPPAARGCRTARRASPQPKFTVRAYAEWDAPFAQGLTLTGGIAHTSGQYLDLANAQRVPAWTRYDIGARYAFKVRETPTVARFTIENVADTRYWGAVDRGSFWVAPPRTYLFSLAAAF
jgi:iron complex outermembrane receptor protein